MHILKAELLFIERNYIQHMNLQKLITIFNERKNFFNNHPDTYKYVKNTFGEKLPVGTKISISVQRPNEVAKNVEFAVEEIDKKFLDSFSDVIGD